VCVCEWKEKPPALVITGPAACVYIEAIDLSAVAQVTRA